MRSAEDSVEPRNPCHILQTKQLHLIIPKPKGGMQAKYYSLQMTPI